jgi:hypothetical protein
MNDIILAVANVLLMIGVVPLCLAKKEKLPNIFTSLVTSFALLVCSVVNADLKLYFASTVCFISSSLWIIIFTRRVL